MKFQEDGEVKSRFVYCLLFVFVSQIHEFFSIAKILSFQNEFECQQLGLAGRRLEILKLDYIVLQQVYLLQSEALKDKTLMFIRLHGRVKH